MPKYRLYCLDLDGTNVETQSLIADTDEEAVEQARSLTDLRQCEIWQGKRMVASVNFDRSANA